MVSVTLPPIVLVEVGSKEAGLGLCKLSGLLEVAKLVEAVAFDREARRLCRLARKKFRPFWLYEGLKIHGINRSTGQVGAGQWIWERQVRGVSTLEGPGSHNRQRMALGSAARV